MQLDIWGGAGEHGRSSYLLHNDRIGVLLDCGVKKTGAGQYPLVDPNVIPRLNAVFLSHAHEDHSMALPLLYKHGYRGVVWTTRATAQQLDTYFASWKKYVRGQSAELPYGDEDVKAIRFAYLEDAGASGEWIDAAPHVKVCWGRSGHLVGSVWMMLELGDGGPACRFGGDRCRLRHGRRGAAGPAGTDWRKLPLRFPPSGAGRTCSSGRGNGGSAVAAGPSGAGSCEWLGADLGRARRADGARSGMAERGRADAAARSLDNRLAAGSFGQRLLDEPESEGGCSVEAIRYKVHQGVTDVRRMLRAFGSRQSVPVHTGRSATDALCAALAAEGFAGLHSLGPGEALRF
ncbi:MBL fold metallo-hydrolase [Paenibacillus elgii]|uniref:MBL fold metallo-hydrolase n=1 Tax=Paenibacillus elgii TaxID=189691 RepID=UPI0013D00C35|nr:MBL fold metallo-hydrolase [Paenibacillus elgii]